MKVLAYAGSVLLGMMALSVTAQPAGGGQTAVSGRAAAEAHFDLSGYWMPVITEDWRYRMATPPIGDYQGVPLSAEGRQVAESWDREADIAAGDECKLYGMAGLLRMPLRLHISWEDDDTLRIETDAGQQTRLLHFRDQIVTGSSLQGYSRASWFKQPQRAGFGPAPSVGPGHLRVETTHLSEAYLRRNGVAYSDETKVTEYFVRHDDFGDAWFTVTTVVEDPNYLTGPFVTSTHFRRESDAGNWNPRGCEMTAPVR